MKGSQNIVGILGLSAAVNHLNSIDPDKIEEHEKELKRNAVEKLKEQKNIIPYHDFNDSGIITFNVKNIFAQDVATYLSTKNDYIRNGSHCATCRASIYDYNEKKDIDALVKKCY